MNCDSAPKVQIVENAESRGGADLLPKEIAQKVSRWLQRNNVPQKYFAEKMLKRSQGSFSDYLTKAPPTVNAQVTWPWNLATTVPVHRE